MSVLESINMHPATIQIIAKNFLALTQHKMGVNNNNGDQELVSDGKSRSGINNDEGLRLFDDGLVRVDEEDKLHQYIKGKFLSSLDALGLHTQVEAIHKNVYCTLAAQAKLHSFCFFARVIEKQNKGYGNVRHAWFGGSKHEIKNIFKHGFDHTLLDNGIYGHGISVSPADAPLASLQTSVVDKDGLKHLVLCRVILGRQELIQPNSIQSCPSSAEFDSGVDNLLSPTKYIMWSINMNSHILPEYVISFRSPSNLNKSHQISAPIMKPSPMLFPTLVSELAKILPPNTIRLIQKHQWDHKEEKITTQEFIQQLRRIVGDNLLVRVVKSYKDKLDKLSRLTPNKCKKPHGACVCSKKKFIPVRRSSSSEGKRMKPILQKTERVED